MKGWIRGNTKIGPVSGCSRQLSSRPLQSRDHDQLSIWRLNSLMGDGSGTVVNKYVTVVSEETRIEDIGESTVKPVAKARPKQTPSSMLSSTTISVPYHERKWMDVEPGRFDKSCLDVLKLMFALLRHDDTIPREETWHQYFVQNLHLLRIGQFEHGKGFLQRGCGTKKRFQYCVDPRSLQTLQNLRAIQGHSGGKHIDPTLQDNVLLPNDFAEHICHVGSSHDLHSIIPSGLIKGGKCVEREACGVLHSRKSDVRSSAQRSRVRPDEAQNCSVQKTIGKYNKIQKIGVI